MLLLVPKLVIFLSFCLDQDGDLSGTISLVMTQCCKRIKDTVQKLASDHKDIHSSVSRVGKAIDKVFILWFHLYLCYVYSVMCTLTKFGFILQLILIKSSCQLQKHRVGVEARWWVVQYLLSKLVHRIFLLGQLKYLNFQENMPYRYY